MLKSIAWAGDVEISGTLGTTSGTQGHMYIFWYNPVESRMVGNYTSHMIRNVFISMHMCIVINTVMISSHNDILYMLHIRISCGYKFSCKNIL